MKETNFTKILCLCLMFFGVLGTQKMMAQCPVGQTQVCVTTIAGAFDTENGWELVDVTANTVLACESSGPGVVAGMTMVCATDGNVLELHTYDDFGDTWNGAEIEVATCEDGSVNGCTANNNVLLPSFQPGDPGPAQANGNPCPAGGAPSGVSTNIFPVAAAGDIACIMCTINCPVDPVDGDSIFTAVNTPGLCEGAVVIPPASQTGCSGLAIDDAPFVEFPQGAGNVPQGTIMPILFNGTAPSPTNPAEIVTVTITVEGDLDFCAAAPNEQFDLQNGGVSLINIPTVTGPAFNCQGNSYTAPQCAPTDFVFMMPYSTWTTLGNQVDLVFVGGGTSRTLCGAPPNDGAFGSAQWAVPPMVTHNSPFALAPGADASGVYPVGCTEVTFTTFAPGGIPVTCPIQVCVEDVDAPVITNCPADLVFNLLPGACDIVVTYAVGPAEDNCMFLPPIGPAVPLIWNLAPNNGGGAGGMVFFDITNNSASDVQISSFNVNLDGPTDVNVYTIANSTHVGNNTIAGAWTQVAVADANGAVFGNNCFAAALDVPVLIPAGATYAFGLEAVSTTWNYTNGNGANQVQTDGVVTVTLGTATNTPFGAPFDPRVFQCGIEYNVITPLVGCVAESGVIIQTDGTGFTSGETFSIGTTPQRYEVCDNAGNIGVCEFNVIVNEFPNATEVLAANDNVQISLDPNGSCTLVSIDAILEGGPYGCYDNFFFSRSPAYNGDAACAPPVGTGVPGCSGAPADAVAGMIPFSCEDIGRTITVTIIDPNTCNEAWALVTVEDKIEPVIICEDRVITCTQDFETGFQNTSSFGEVIGPLALPDPGSEDIEIDIQAPADATVKGLEVCLRLDHTWTSDVSLELEDPDGNIFPLINSPCGTADNIEACFSDSHAAPYNDALDCGPLNLAVSGNFQPVTPFSSVTGATAGGTWILRYTDGAGGDAGTLQFATLNVQWCGTVTGPVATDNCGPVDLSVVQMESERTCSTSGMILQTWTATDWSGNQASCVSTITIRKPSFDDLMLPGDLELDCCTDEYPNPGANVVLKDVAAVNVGDAGGGAIADGDVAVRYDFDLNQGVSADRTIKDLNIRFDATHNDIRDLTIEVAQLSATGAIIQGSRRTIYEGEIIYDGATAIDAEYLLCSNGMFTDINATFDDEGCDIHEACVDFSPSVAGTFAPFQALSSFDDVLVNTNVGPDFTILVSDRNNVPGGTDGSGGTINAIEVTYSYNDPTAVAGAFIDGRPISHNDACGFSVTFEDDVVDVCPTSFKVLRTWKIIDWCTNTKVEHEQTIKVLDSTPPVIAAPRTRNLDMDALTIPVFEPAVASTVHGSCVGNVTLPELGICLEDCSGVESWRTFLFSADGANLLDAIDGNGGMLNEALVLDLDEGPDDDVAMPAPFLITLPDGSQVFIPAIRLETLREPDAIYLARYVVRDSCGNEATADVFIQLIDRVAPVPICREETQLSLTGAPDEVTTICADDLDEGSYDNCSNVHFFIRKMNDPEDLDPICNVDFGLGPDPSLTFEILGRDGVGAFTLAQECKYTSCVDFTCDDIGEDNQVFLLVVDDYVVDFINDYLDEVFPFIDAIVDYNTLPLTVLPGDQLDDQLDIFSPADLIFQADNDRRNRGQRFFEFYLNEDPNADGLFVLPTAILWEGHYNFCMVNVHIEDKVRPTCAAPADVWLTCDELPENVDYDDDAALDALFGTATGADNCNATVVPLGATNGLDLCGVGTVTRRWRTEDDFGNRSIGSCQQRITVQPVTNYCITFPEDFEGDCDNTNAPADLTFEENGCDLLAISRDFEDFPAADNGECRKEIITWKVINWCEYDGISDATRVERDGNGDGRIDDGEYCSTGAALVYQPNNMISYPSTGFYEYKQQVKIFDDVAPEVSYDGAVKFCGGDMDEDPCTGQVDIEIDVTELCTDQITTTWSISAFASSFGNADINGGGSISLRLPLGTHTARFQVSDDCGNTSQLDITFSIVDCKAPTPVCHNGLSIDVMPLAGMVELWAVDFDASSFDYCSDFIFRANVVEDQNGDGIITADDYVTVLPPSDRIVVDCDDVSNGLTMVQLWVAEQDGTADDSCADNQDNDFCVTFVEVQDNNGVCSGSKVGLGGKIANENNESVQDVSIEVNNSSSLMGNVITDATGDYEFTNLPLGGDYSVTPMRNDDITNGVSTFDLVLISKHILNVQLLNSPYKILAADANRSNSVSTLDLVAIRKAVLRVSNTFPNNTSWRFVDKDQILNSTNPWSATIQEVINRNNLASTDLNANFVAIKVGDVNGDATPNSILGVDDRTFNGNLVFSADEQSVNAGEEFSVDFVATQNVQGYQFTMDYDEKSVELVDIVDGLATEANNFNVIADQGLIATSWNKDQSTADATMFTLVFRAKADVEVSNIVSVSSEVTAAEAYNVDGSLMGISLAFGGQVQASTFELEQNVPNPFKGETTIGFTLPEASSATITISDVTGKVLKVVKGDYTKGYNTVSLKRSDIGAASGVLSYQLDTPNNSATKQMIIIE